MIYLRLFLEFFKIGLFAVGGGLATLPFLSDLSDKTGWFTQAQLADMIAISESTPGPIGVNSATYVGFTSAGPLGSLCATLGLITPSVIIILIVARILKAFKENQTVKAVFYGLRPASTGLIAAAGWTVISISILNLALFKETGNVLDLFSIKALVLAVIIYLLSNNIKQTKKLHPVYFLALAALAGIIFNFAG